MRPVAHYIEHVYDEQPPDDLGGRLCGDGGCRACPMTAEELAGDWVVTSLSRLVGGIDVVLFGVSVQPTPQGGPGGLTFSAQAEDEDSPIPVGRVVPMAAARDEGDGYDVLGDIHALTDAGAVDEARVVRLRRLAGGVDSATCPACSVVGSVLRVTAEPDGADSRLMDCPVCSGSRKLNKRHDTRINVEP